MNRDIKSMTESTQSGHMSTSSYSSKLSKLFAKSTAGITVKSPARPFHQYLTEAGTWPGGCGTRPFAPTNWVLFGT